MRISYPAAGNVSVWIGTFVSEIDFDRCVDGPITKTLGLKTPLASICETSFEDEPQPLRKLIQGFSGWKSFIDQAEEVATARGIQTANVALVCYYLKCEGAPEQWEKLHFLGSFAGQDVS
jgi:hypothetical protein